jgi:hypothetical protein
MRGDLFAVSLIARQDSKDNTICLYARDENERGFMSRLILLTHLHRRTLERAQIQKRLAKEHGCNCHLNADES